MIYEYDQILEINGNKLTKKYIQSLSKQERIDLIEPIFNLMREVGFIYMDDIKSIDKSWKKLLDHKVDINETSLFNNSSLGTDICKFFCHSFYQATERGKPTMVDNFNDDNKLKAIIRNRLGLDWLDDDERGPGINEAFNLSPKMVLFQSQRSMRLVNATSMFKPIIAKYMYTKYANEGDVCFDYSAGFGGRMLGAASCNRKYIGVDPLTIDELENMKRHFDLQNIILIKDGSENIRLEDSVDFSFSSPPYLSQEHYSDDKTQANNNGDDYFYDVYWKKTLENIKYMLKPDKVFALNVLEKYTQMINMTKGQFGEPFDVITLRTVRNHLTKGNGKDNQKYEPIYIFRNIK